MYCEEMRPGQNGWGPRGEGFTAGFGAKLKYKTW